MSTLDPASGADALDLIAVLRASHDRLRAVVEPLSAEQLRAPAYPSQWSIADTLSHLGSGAQITSLVVDAGLTGRAAPGQDDLVAIWDVWNAKSADDQAADALAADAVLVEKIEALDADQRATASFAIWSGPTDISGLVRARVSEHATHTWDVEAAVHPTAALAPEAAAIVLDGVGRLLGFIAKPGPTGRIYVHTTNPDREFTLSLADPVTLEPWDGAGSTGELTLPAEAFARLLYGRLDPEHTPAVTAHGIDLDTLRPVFPGF